MLHTNSKRARLTLGEVLAIFNMKNSSAVAAKIAQAHGVNEKTIRDIWKGRTWAKDTLHLDKSRSPTVKEAGRPVGCKKSSKSCITKTKDSSLQQVKDKNGKKGIDDELFEWELKMSQQSSSEDTLRKSMMEWAS